MSANQCSNNRTIHSVMKAAFEEVVLESDFTSLSRKLESIEMTIANYTEKSEVVQIEMIQKMDDIKLEMGNQSDTIEQQKQIISNLNDLITKQSELIVNQTEILTKVKKILDLPLKNCNVKCTLTIDNQIDSVAYNDIRLDVTGDPHSHFSENSITFESCHRLNPGELTISGTDMNVEKFCYWGGLILHCIADDESNPWHNFVSDQDRWRVNDGSRPCADPTSWLMNRTSSWMIDMYNAGAKSIWANAQQVTLIGKP